MMGRSIVCMQDTVVLDRYKNNNFGNNVNWPIYELLNIIDDTEIDFYGFHSEHELLVFDPSHVKQPLASNGAAIGAVLVREVDHGFDARLDDHLGALVAGEQRHVINNIKYSLELAQNIALLELLKAQVNP